MKSQPTSISRRHFLSSIGKVAGSSVMLKAAATIGLTMTVSGCGASSASELPPVTPSPTDPSTPPPTDPPPAINPDPRPSDWPQGSGNNRTVTILGSGIAGMTAAFEMNKLGYQCTILEATARAGGRCRTIRAGDTIEETDSVQSCQFDNDPALYFNPGPARIPHHHDLLLGYCRQFSIELETFTNENRAALYHSTNAFNGQPQLARRVIADSRGYISELLSTAVNQNALDQALTTQERADTIEMLKSYGALTANSSYTGSNRAGFEGQENAGGTGRNIPVSPLDLTEVLNSDFWQYQTSFAESIDQQPTLLQPVGGMDKIAKAFEQQVADNIIYQAVVSQIRKTGSGGRIVYQDQTGSDVSVESDYCICTIPATVLKNIDADFSAVHQNEIDNFQYTKACKIAFQSRRFWEQEHNIYGGISWTNQNITQLWYPNSGFGRDQGVIVGAYTFSNNAGDSFATMNPQQRLNAGITQANQLHPQYGNEVTNGISICWPKVPFQLGAWGASPANNLLNADGNIYFAGEHLSNLKGWQEGAILSAYHAVNAIVERDTML